MGSQAAVAGKSATQAQPQSRLGGGVEAASASTPLVAPSQVLQHLLRAGVIQAKLAISQPADPLEQEADETAEAVMRMPSPSPASVSTADSGIQRKCSCSAGGGHVCDECAEKDEQKIQTKEAPGLTPSLTPQTEAHIESLRGGGQPLPSSVRSFFEPRFGRDFSGVRIHSDAHANDIASAVQARAFTLGKDIVFGAGQYAPQSTEGQKLLAHELAHIVQQPTSIPAGGQTLSRATDGSRSVTSYAGCNRAITRVSHPKKIIERAIQDASLAVSFAINNISNARPRTMAQIDRHFHCPLPDDLAEILKTFTNISQRLGNTEKDITCTNKCRKDKIVQIDDAGKLELCTPFFQSTPEEQKYQIIAGFANAAGRKDKIKVHEPPYNDFTIPASKFLNNGIAYAMFARETTGEGAASPQKPPCHVKKTIHEVVVPQSAKDNPKDIYRLSGFKGIPPGAAVQQVFEDREGSFFIYQNGLPGGKLHPPEKVERFYLEGTF